MEEVKMEINGNTMTIEGEFDIELDFSSMHFGYPPEDEKIFDKTSFEIRSYGEIGLKYLPALVEWINRNSACRPEDPTKWPRWKISFERIVEKR